MVYYGVNGVQTFSPSYPGEDPYLGGATPGSIQVMPVYEGGNGGSDITASALAVTPTPIQQAAVLTQPVSYQLPPKQPVIMSDTGQIVGPLGAPVAQPVSFLSSALGGLLGGEASGVIGTPGLPGGEYSFRDIIPGGAPFRFPDIPGEDIIKHWWTGTTLFAVTALGNHYVAKKVRRRFLPDTWLWKKYRPGGAIVIGKQLNSTNLARALRVVDRYRGRKRKLNLVIPGGHRRFGR